MKKIVGYILFVSLILLCAYYYKTVFVIVCIITGFLVLVVVTVSISSAIESRKAKKFRAAFNGMYFLWYSSSKKLKPTVESELLPLLDFDHQIIFNNQGEIESKLLNDQLFYLRRESLGIKLPVVYKICEDRIYCESLFEEVDKYRKNELGKEVYVKKVILKLNKIKNEQTKHKRRRS